MKTKYTSRERVLTTFARQAADRVPVNYAANPGIHARLLAHFGLKPDDGEGLLQALGVDFRWIGAPYAGPRLHPERTGRQVDPCWGVRTRWVEHGAGGYWDYCDFPLQNATVEEVAAWPMPSPDDFNYTEIAERCRRHPEVALYVGGAGLGDVINGNGFLRGTEQTLVDLVTDDPAGLLLARRRTEINLEIIRRTIEAARGRIDFLWMGEDLGTQRSPIISLDLYRRHVRPLHQQVVDLARAHGLPVMIHCCGASSWAFNDFIDMGIGVVDTLQPEAAGMDPQHLKKTYGGRLAFHGCISTAGPVSFGSVADVVKECRAILEVMMPGGGYCFAPTHCLQDNSPTENVLAMYATAADRGRYAPRRETG